MFSQIVTKAETAAQGLARDAGLRFLVAVLQFGAVLFIFGGVAWALSEVIPPPVALIVTGAGLGLAAAITFAVKLRDPAPPPAQTEEIARAREDDDPLARLVSRFGAVGKTVDVVAAGMFTRQLQRRPVTTLAATVAVGMLMGMIADAADGD